MKKEPKKRILSKRVLIALGIVSFLIIAGSLFSIISIDKEGEFEKPSENEENEEPLEEDENEEEDLLDTFFDNFPFWIAGFVALAWVFDRFRRKIF